MPLVPYKLDPGFNQPPVFQPEPTPEVRGGGLFQIGENWKNIQSDAAQLPDLFTAAFNIENDVVNTVELLSKPVWKRDENFDLEANLKAAELWDDHRWDYIGVESAGEFLYKTQKIQKEKAARKLIASAGPDGVAAMIVAGVASPTVLLPFVGPAARGAKAVGLGAAWGLAGGALQEIPLQLNQELRTLEESAISIGFSTVVGGVLGGAIGYLNKRTLEAVADGMAPTPPVRTISPSEERVLIEREIKVLEDQTKGVDPDNVDALDEIGAEIGTYRARLAEIDATETRVRVADEIDTELRATLGTKKAAVGADIPDFDAGSLRNMLGIGERLTKLAGPVTATIGQRVSAKGRRIMAQLSTAGLRLERNVVLDRNGEIVGAIPSNEGGTVEALINSRRGDTLSLVNKAYENYSDYWYGSGQKPGAFRNTRAYTGALLSAGKSGKMNRRQFFDQVGLAMLRGDVHDIPEVAKTAQEFRKYYDELLQEAQELGLIPSEIKQVAPDMSFLNRVWDTAAIKKNPNAFQRMLSDHFKQALQADLDKIHASYSTAEARDLQRLADSELPLEQARALRDQFQDELKALDAAEDDDIGPMEELISDLRSEMAKNTRVRKALEKQLETVERGGRQPIVEQITRLQHEREVYHDEIAKLTELGGPDMAQRAQRRAELKRRIRGLNRSRFMVEERHRGKLQQIENIEEANLNSLHRAARAGVRAQNALDADDATFVRELKSLQSALSESRTAAMKLDAQIDALQPKVKAADERAVDQTEAVEGDYTPEEKAMVIQDARDLYDAAAKGLIPEGTTASKIPHLPDENLWAELAAREETIRSAVEQAKKAKPQKVNIADLTTQQPYVEPGRIAKAGASRDPVWVVKIGNNYVIRNGNHRIEAALLRGDTEINARVVEIEPSGRNWLPSKVDLADDEATFAKLFEKEAKLEAAERRAVEIEEDLENFLNVNYTERGRDEMRGIIQDALDHSLRKVNDLNNRRAKRIAKLEADAKKFDAQAWEAHRKEIADRVKTRRENVREKVRELGGDNYDMQNGVADFSQRADEIAQLAKERVLGSNVRLAGFDAMSDKRGTELARTLSIPSEIPARAGFLVMDAEHLLHVYANTLIPDVELVRRIGPLAPDGERNLQFRELNEEQTLVEMRAEAQLREDMPNATPEAFEKARAKLMDGIAQEYEQIRRNLDVTIRRLRHQWGVPSDPDSLITRGVQIVLSAQGLRLLGTVGLASIPDISKPIMRYGLGRTLRSSWVPMVSNWKAIKLSAQEARRAFVAVETMTADRAFQLAELMEFARRKTKAEMGLQWATSKIGIVAGFAPWTDLMKTLSFMTFNSKILDDLDLALNATSKTDPKRIEAISFLNSLGLSENLQRQIWDEMQNGGAEKIGGVWVPQTERWTNKAAVRAYRAAINSEGAASILTPGVELPKIANANLPAKLFFNLKSFALASTSKTLMAGLQQRDMAVLNGVMISLALGGLSYYLRSVAAGGEAQKRMEAASWEQWVDEAVDASGLLGAISIAQQIGDNIPGVKHLTRVSGVSGVISGKPAAQTSRSSGAGLVEDAFGPTADLVFTLAQVITGSDNPTRAQIHKVRQLLPLQNLFYLRRLFDQMENAVGDKFNLEGNRR